MNENECVPKSHGPNEEGGESKEKVCTVLHSYPTTYHSVIRYSGCHAEYERNMLARVGQLKKNMAISQYQFQLAICNRFKLYGIERGSFPLK